MMLKFTNYDLHLKAEISNPNLRICPVLGWNSKRISVTAKFRCECCGYISDPYQLCKGDKVVVPIPKKVKSRSRVHLKSHEGISANLSVKCLCGRHCIVVVDHLPGVDLTNGDTTTLMSLSISGMVPIELCDFQFHWISMLDGDTKPICYFPLSDDVEAELEIELQDDKESFIGLEKVVRVKVTSSFV